MADTGTAPAPMTAERVRAMLFEMFGEELPSKFQIGLTALRAAEQRGAEQATAAAREEVATWMLAQSLATGHGDTLSDLLGEASWQIEEIRARGKQQEPA